MSSNSFIWTTEGGDLGTADWGCLAGRCASLCLRLHTVAVRQAALVSDESALEACACSRLCAIQIYDLFYLYIMVMLSTLLLTKGSNSSIHALN